MIPRAKAKAASNYGLRTAFTEVTMAAEAQRSFARYGVLSVAMTDRIIGCPHQEGIDYQGQWCPLCEFWKGRDRFTGERGH